MAAGKHKAKSKKNLFCTEPSYPCHCPSANNYRTNCDPGGWAYQAHHILCKASVRQVVEEPKNIKETVKKTRWCVNARHNMVALPVWGETIMWYTKNTSKPPFANRVQHNWDHNGASRYRPEVEGELQKIVSRVKDAIEEHDSDGVGALTGALNGLATTFRTRLRGRAQRRGGTHKQFQNNGADPQWWMPFSMAATASAKGFPRNWKSNVPSIVRKLFG